MSGVVTSGSTIVSGSLTGVSSRVYSISVEFASNTVRRSASKLVWYVNDAKTKPPRKRRAIRAIENRRFSLLALLLFLISITFVILIIHLNNANGANNIPKRKSPIWTSPNGAFKVIIFVIGA